jgi:hypothetical protein
VMELAEQVLVTYASSRELGQGEKFGFANGVSSFLSIPEL